MIVRGRLPAVGTADGATTAHPIAVCGGVLAVATAVARFDAEAVARLMSSRMTAAPGNAPSAHPGPGVMKVSAVDWSWWHSSAASTGARTSQSISHSSRGVSPAPSASIRKSPQAARITIGLYLSTARSTPANSLAKRNGSETRAAPQFMRSEFFRPARENPHVERWGFHASALIPRNSRRSAAP